MAYDVFAIFFAGLSTECPVGTKCVQDIFCNENAIMVSYRVQLTHAQKNQRGVLPVRLFLTRYIYREVRMLWDRQKWMLLALCLLSLVTLIANVLH